ncbi:MAG: hypothetical protein A3K60_02560 [Euryarchaeota archaeon RBG_19FT_COMBO_56_21]|nr:MAG: hypothetical protein A3K60_02560 [Euryarchaeota archaeon RBG_19FT_COMBO_56_21]
MNPTTKLMGAALASVAVMMIATLGYATTQSQRDEDLNTFSSERELRLFLTKERPEKSGDVYYRAPDSMGSDFKQEASGSYSTTNIQVAGVDEDDIVKTDGEYIYAASSNNVTIIKAYPPESLANVSVIEISGLTFGSDSHYLQLQGIFMNADRLVLVVNAYSTYYWGTMDDTTEYQPPKTIVAVYDVEDRANPTFVRSVAVSGYYLSSRMIGEHVYLIAQAQVWTFDDEITLPSLWEDDVSSQVKATDIRYDPDMSQASSFLNILALNIGSGEHDLLSVVAGWASVVYMSNNALYFTVQKYQGSIEWSDGVESPIDSYTAFTTIYKIQIDALSMSVDAKGDVKGWLLNQFSMDENGSYLRVATTTSWVEPENAVYVLDDGMVVVGKLEGLAPSERIYSSRFIGNSLYLVTFRQIDPLFVIDLTDPLNPNVMGELKIPGFSSYLHPVDEDHILGIGIEGGTLKISLFNVSDPTNPLEQSKYVSDVIWYSEALYDHKSVLFDLEKELLVIPGYSYLYDYNEYKYVGGAMVFRVSLSDGISLRGIITHESNESYWGQSVTRSLYIGEYLYTIGDRSVQVNRLDDLSYVDSLIYSDFRYHYWYALRE